MGLKNCKNCDKMGLETCKKCEITDKNGWKLMERKILTELKEWKSTSAGKTAALITGARRVGKSYAVERFAQKEYKS